MRLYISAEEMEAGNELDLEEFTVEEEARIPGFLDTVDSIELLHVLAVDSQFALNSFLAFSVQTGLLWAAETLDLASGKLTWLDFIRASLRRIRDRIKGSKVIERESREVFLPMDEIHCPKVTGCKAWYKLANSRGKKSALSAKVLGFGGGYGWSGKVTHGTRIPSFERCNLMSQLFELEYLLMEDPSGRRWPIVNIVGPRRQKHKGIRPTQIPSALDECEEPVVDAFNKNYFVDSYLLTDNPGPHDLWVNIQKGKTAEFKLGLKVFGHDVGTEISTELTREVEFKYELQGGRDYHAYSAQEQATRLWNWT